MKSVGRHLVLELWGCQNLNSTAVVERALLDIVESLKLTVLSMEVHPFSPIGVTGVAIVSESHVVIHTWPELGYAAVDVFTCGEQRNPEDAVPVLRHHFSPSRIQVMEMTRGLITDEVAPAGAEHAEREREAVAGR